MTHTISRSTKVGIPPNQQFLSLSNSDLKHRQGASTIDHAAMDLKRRATRTHISTQHNGGIYFALTRFSVRVKSMDHTHTYTYVLVRRVRDNSHYRTTATWTPTRTAKTKTQAPGAQGRQARGPAAGVAAYGQRLMVTAASDLGLDTNRTRPHRRPSRGRCTCRTFSLTSSIPRCQLLQRRHCCMSTCSACPL